MVAAHDHVPHFSVTGLDGTPVEYRKIWQHRHLVLVVLPETADEVPNSYADTLRVQMREFDPEDVALVITRDAIETVPRPGVLIADRWGEIAFVVEAAEVPLLPAAGEVADWVRYVQSKCPECEGEAR